MALKALPYLPLYVRDFQIDEKLMNCSAESTGVYIRLLCVMHMMEDYGVISLKAKEKQNESTIANFASKLTRYMPYQSDVIERSLEELIEEGVLTLDGDRLYQKRMVRDAEISEKRTIAGKNRGRKPKYDHNDNTDVDTCNSKTEAKTEAKVQAKTQQKCENEIEYEYENEDIDIDSKKEDKKEPSLIEQRFNQFWAAYPRKVGKGEARRRFLKIAPTQKLLDQIMAAVEVAKQSDQWRKDNGQFIPYPSTWLNQERWEDGEPGAASSVNFDPEDPYADWGGSDG